MLSALCLLAFCPKFQESLFYLSWEKGGLSKDCSEPLAQAYYWVYALMEY